MKNKIFFLTGILLITFINFNNISAENLTIIPIKKPSLTSEEISKKLSKNIIKPLKKPNKNKKVVVKEEKIIVKKEIKKLRDEIEF